MTNWIEYRGVTVERTFPGGYYRAHLDDDRFMADDLDGALTEIDRRKGPHRLAVTLEIDLDPDDWMDASGTALRQSVTEDARRALPDRIRHLLEQGFGPSGGVTVTGIAVTDRDDGASAEAHR